MKKLLAVVLLLWGCNDPSEDGPLGGAPNTGGKSSPGGAEGNGGSRASGGFGGLGGEPGEEATSCKSVSDCPALAQAGVEHCAEVHCDERDGRCSLIALDEDLDGYPVKCRSGDLRIVVRQYPGTDAIDENLWDCRPTLSTAHPLGWDGPVGAEPNRCDGIDSDCDGIVDNGKTKDASCKCKVGQRRRCALNEDTQKPSEFLAEFYEHDESPEGACQLGWTECNSEKRWGLCLGAIEPKDESCGSLGEDLNCNSKFGKDELDKVDPESKVEYACDEDGDGQLVEEPEKASVCDEEPVFPRVCQRWIETATAPQKVDCNDSAFTIGSGFAESCDGIDSDCGGEVSDTFDADVVMPSGGNHVVGYACVPPSLVMSCEVGYGNCDGYDDTGISSGCETDMRTRANCGNCGQKCNFACSGQGSALFKCAEVASFALGYYHTCAALTDGRVACWGEGESGQLGDGVRLAQPAPVIALDIGASIPAVSSVAAGWEHTCAVVETGDVYCWGKSDTSQAGSQTTSVVKASKVANIPAPGAASLALGAGHSCVVLKTGGIRCWGDPLEGRLGIGTLPGESSAGLPSPLDARIKIASVESMFTSADQVAPGASHTCALQDGQVYCTGANWSFQLGQGSEPDLEQSLYFIPVPGLEEGVTQIASGYATSCALLDGSVLCWGSNDVGQAGQPGGDPVGTPLPISGLSNVSAVAVGASFACALSEGDVFCWGENAQGQLGRETEGESSETPVAIAGLHGVTAIQVGTHHACALLDGQMTCWGSNVTGQLGRGEADELAHFAPAVVVPLGL